MKSKLKMEDVMDKREYKQGLQGRKYYFEPRSIFSHDDFYDDELDLGPDDLNPNEGDK